MTIDRFPYPIARVYRELDDPGAELAVRREALSFTLYQLLRTVVLTVLGEILVKPPPSPHDVQERPGLRDAAAALTKALARLDPPNLNSWITLLRTLTQPAQGHPQGQARHLLLGADFLGDLSAALRAADAILVDTPIEYLPRGQSNPRQPALSAFLCLYNHGSHTRAREKRRCEEDLQRFRPALDRLLKAFAFLEDRDLLVLRQEIPRTWRNPAAAGLAERPVGSYRLLLQEWRGMEAAEPREQDVPESLCEALRLSPVAMRCRVTGRAVGLFPLFHARFQDAAKERVRFFEGHYLTVVPRGGPVIPRPRKCDRLQRNGAEPPSLGRPDSSSPPGAARCLQEMLERWSVQFRPRRGGRRLRHLPDIGRACSASQRAEADSTGSPAPTSAHQQIPEQALTQRLLQCETGLERPRQWTAWLDVTRYPESPALHQALVKLARWDLANDFAAFAGLASARYPFEEPMPRETLLTLEALHRHLAILPFSDPPENQETEWRAWTGRVEQFLDLLVSHAHGLAWAILSCCRKVEELFGSADPERLRTWRRLVYGRYRDQPTSAGTLPDVILADYFLWLANDLADTTQPGTFAEIEGLYRRSLEIREERWRAFPDSVQAAGDLGVALEGLGDFLVERGGPGDWERAEGLYQRSLKVRQETRRTCPDSAPALRDLGVALSKMGDFRMARRSPGDWKQAEVFYRRSLTVCKGVWRTCPGSVPALRDLGVALSKMGDFRMARRGPENLAQVEGFYRSSLKIREEVRRVSPASVQDLRDLGVALSKMGDFRMARRGSGDLKRAEGLYRRSLEISAEVRRVLPASTQAARDLGVALERLGDFLVERGNSGDLAPAERLYRFSLEIREEIGKANPRARLLANEQAGTACKLSLVCDRLGRGEEADEWRGTATATLAPHLGQPRSRWEVCWICASLASDPAVRWAWLDRCLCLASEDLRNPPAVGAVTDANIQWLTETVVGVSAQCLLQLRDGAQMGLLLHLSWLMGQVLVAPRQGSDPYLTLRRRDLLFLQKALSTFSAEEVGCLQNQMEAAIGQLSKTDPTFATAVHQVLASAKPPADAPGGPQPG